MMSENIRKKIVLYCAPINKLGNSGRYIIDAMRQLGYSVIGYDYRDKENFEMELLALVDEKKPDYFFTQKGEILNPEMIRKIRNKGCVTIYWCFDAALGDWYVPLAREHDFVLSNNEDHILRLLKEGVKNAKWVHQGFTQEFFGIEGGETFVDPCYADLAMIGSMGNPIYNRRCESALLLKKHGFDIKWWGKHLAHDFRNMKYHLQGIGRIWAGSEVYMKDFADVIRHIKIFIGEDADIPIKGKYLSNRSFAVMGCGGFYLCRRTPGVEYAFEIGKEVDVFDTDDELIGKVEYYLKHENERKIIAAAGQKKILVKYTYKKQLEKIFDWVATHSEKK
jgi:hypothetical protein